MLDTLFAELPTELDELAVPVRGKIDEAFEGGLELDAHAVQVRNRFEKLHLSATNRIARLLLAFVAVRTRARSLGLVFGDPRLVFELWQKSRKLCDLSDDPAHTRQLAVRLLHRIRAQPLHGSTIAPQPTDLFGSAGAQTSVMDSADSRRRVEAARVARMATVGGDGRPHLVPISFALDGQILYFAVDAKPKRTTNLKRLRNIAANPAVSILVDHYEDEWNRLWWVRLDGQARVVTDQQEAQHALVLLAERYSQYRVTPPAGPVVAVAIEDVTGWSAS